MGKRPRQKSKLKKGAKPRDTRDASFPFGYGSTKPIKSPDEVAEEQAKLCWERADSFAQKGEDDKEKVESEKAKFWRSLPKLSKRDAILQSCEMLDASEEALAAFYAMGSASNLGHVASHALWHLFNLAESHGHASAADSLLCSIEGAVKGFVRLADERPELFRPYTRRRIGIPAIVSQNTEKMREAEEFTKKLQTGGDFPLAILPTGKSGKRLQFKNPANALAIRLQEEIEFTRVWDGWYRKHLWWEQAVKLEPFSAKTWKTWAELAWRIILDATRGKPERSKHLRPFGKSAETKKPKFCKELHAATREANVRAKIKARLFEALRQLSGAE